LQPVIAFIDAVFQQMKEAELELTSGFRDVIAKAPLRLLMQHSKK
jgi:hypothetical protein